MHSADYALTTEPFRQGHAVYSGSRGSDLSERSKRKLDGF